MSTTVLGADESLKTAAADSPVVMQPFKVMAEWMDIQPMLKDGLIDTVRVVRVQKGSPAARAGLREGMQIVELQGISVRGLTDVELRRRMHELPPANQLAVKVQGIAVSRAILVPFSASKEAGAPPEASGDGGAPIEVDVATAKKSIEAIRQALRKEMDRVRVEARAHGQATFDPALMDDATHELQGLAKGHLALLCDTAVAAGDDRAAQMLANVCITAINGRKDYAVGDKATVLKYLPKLPNLIATVDHMNWFDGATDAMAAGWKKAGTDERDGVLTLNGSRYARLAAGHGVTDALLALARTVRNPDAGKRASGRVLADEIATLKTLMQADTDDPRVLADIVLKSKNKLVFDPVKSVYTLRP